MGWTDESGDQEGCGYLEDVGDFDCRFEQGISMIGHVYYGRDIIDFHHALALIDVADFAMIHQYSLLVMMCLFFTIRFVTGICRPRSCAPFVTMLARSL